MEEQPKAIVTIIAQRGAKSRLQMDEKSPEVMTYANGQILAGYAVKRSGEGVDHVRVSPFGKRTEWIRYRERDGSNPLVDVEYIETPATAMIELANSMEAQAVATTRLAVAIEDYNRKNK